ncbi:MAG: [protein-PII] uridylyltransferase [Methylomonas sp.]|nr:MAG: [protein-PII] uridylyltransferase [Methylobacter sp.]PPD36198.1 MAG: [protein-PII] uridylyltransferase [Methylomonas sp.]
MIYLFPNINSSLFAGQDGLQQFKLLLKHQYNVLHQKFDPQQSVSELLEERSDFIDQVLSCCCQYFLGEYASQLSLCAVGGYGRRELFPHSDIDILVLLNYEEPALLKEGLSRFFTFLWDIGLKPGYSIRTIKECVSAAQNDQTIMTSLMEIRLINGSAILLEALKAEISPAKIWPADQFFKAKMQEQKLRYIKYHDTAYNLEPNIKEGPGGLRDLHNIAWVFKRNYDTETLRELVKYGFLPEELVKYGFLPETEYTDLVAALNTLWRIRYALHLLTNRAENRLYFDYQRALAWQFGFSSENPSHNNEDVERFMQFYFKTVKGLERQNEMLLQLFNERFIFGDTVKKSAIINDNFVVINDYLEAADDTIFERQPLALFEMFLILQQNPSIKGVRATTIRLIRKSLHLIDDNFRNNKNANRLFIEIFRQATGVTQQLRRMNRYGILAAYMPSFANIVARMQYDLFHIYTVDEHTLFVIRNLRRLSLNKLNELPFCKSVFAQIPKPEILYLAALFHDIAKGAQGDHSIKGEQIARNFCLQHELSAHDTKVITWLVAKHLLMSMTAQRKDISDPQVIHDFAQKVGSVENLNYLYLLTVADIRATNPELWNSWRDALLKQLYAATRNTLLEGLQNPVTLEERLLEAQQEAKDELIRLGLPEALINSAWEHVSEDYFLRFSADEIAWHTIAIASSAEHEFPLVLLRPRTQLGSAEVFVYTKKEGSIFSLCTQTLDLLGLTVLDARIMTTAGIYILSSFQVLEQSSEPIKDLAREVQICKTLRSNLLQREAKGNSNFYRQSRQAKHFPIATNIKFTVDPVSGYTIIELTTTDHAGLLSNIGRVFLEQNIFLQNAKITTIGSRVEDMFYVTDLYYQPITDLTMQETIRFEMLKVLENLTESTSMFA